MRSGASVNRAINNGVKALHGAAAGGHITAMKLLLDWGANMNEDRIQAETGIDRKVKLVRYTERA